MLTSCVLALLSLTCVQQCVIGKEFVQNITEPTDDICTYLLPKGYTVEPCGLMFKVTTKWMTEKEVVVVVRRNTTSTSYMIHGWLVQGRLMNDLVYGRMIPVPGDILLDCSPGLNNTITGVYENGRNVVGAIWQRPAIGFDDYKDIKFRVSVLIKDKSICMLEGELSHKERLELLRESSDSKPTEAPVAYPSTVTEKVKEILSTKKRSEEIPFVIPHRVPFPWNLSP